MLRPAASALPGEHSTQQTSQRSHESMHSASLAERQSRAGAVLDVSSGNAAATNRSM